MTKRSRAWGREGMLFAALLASGTAVGADQPYGGDFWSRPKLTGDWGGLRDRWAAHGITIDLDTVYTFQGVPEGGFEGPLFERFSDEDYKAIPFPEIWC